jgi:hypothetical protein
MTTPPPDARITADQFAALCNLMHTVICEKQGNLDPAEIGDILYYGANRTVCDESRTMARAILAYLGLRFAGQQPVHEPGSGCRFADPDGNCEFHDVSVANALVDEIEAQMRAGDGALSYG